MKRHATRRDRRVAVAGALWTVALVAAYAELTQAGERCRPGETLYCVASGHSRLHIGLVLALIGLAAATAWLGGRSSPTRCAGDSGPAPRRPSRTDTFTNPLG